MFYTHLIKKTIKHLLNINQKNLMEYVILIKKNMATSINNRSYCVSSHSDTKFSCWDAKFRNTVLIFNSNNFIKVVVENKSTKLSGSLFIIGFL